MRRSILLLAVAAISGCAGGPDNTLATPSPPSLVIVEGDGQTAAVGQQVAIKPAVKAVSTSGAPVAGVVVTFSVLSGGGSVIGGTVTTGSDGTARVGGWTLGTTPGANKLRVIGSTTATLLDLTATATAGPPAAVTKVVGDGGTSGTGVAVAAKPTVKVADAFGNSVSGAAVVFAVGTGGGSVAGGSATTGTDGTATVGSWTLGNLVGVNTLIATVAGSGITGNPATFTVNGVSIAASIAKVVGDAQTAPVGTVVPVAPAVRVQDQFGNAVAGQTVTFAVASGGGSVTGASATTSVSGLATVGGWTLGTAPGANSLTATIGGLSATFVATGIATFNPSIYAGTYTGTWTNTTFGSTGTGSATIKDSAAAKIATVTASATGSVLGGGPVSATTRSSLYNSAGATFLGNVPPMGDINGTIDASGKITASATNIPNTTISRWDATGTITPTAISMTFKVTFASGSTAVGTIDLHKP